MARNSVRVRFDDPDHGWIGLSIKTEEAGELQDSFSYTPYDSFLDLITAISLVSQSNSDATASWNAEPTEYDLRFRRSDEQVQLEIQRHPDNRRIKGRGEVVLQVSGTFEEIALPFWRGRRDLRSRFSPEELNRRWHREFPVIALDRLTKRLKG
jgi:hypothetical protein